MVDTRLFAVYFYGGHDLSTLEMADTRLFAVNLYGGHDLSTLEMIEHTFICC